MAVTTTPNLSWRYATAAGPDAEVRESLVRYAVEERTGVRLGDAFELRRRSRRRVPAAIRERIAWFLGGANGRRRTRLLTLDDVLRLIARAIEAPGEYAAGFDHAGHVVNGYQYPATATAARVVRVGRLVSVCVRTANARKGCTGFGRRDIYTAASDAGEAARLDALAYADLLVRVV